MPYATLKMIEENDSYRSSCLNLQASENCLSPDVKRALSSDLGSRYSHLMKNGINSYGGTSIFEEIYSVAKKNTAELFGSKYAEIRPVGGHIAVLAALLSTSRRGQKAAAIGEKYGGYPGYSSKYIGKLLDLDFIEIPCNDGIQEIEYDAFEKMISIWMLLYAWFDFTRAAIARNRQPQNMLPRKTFTTIIPAPNGEIGRYDIAISEKASIIPDPMKPNTIVVSRMPNRYSDLLYGLDRICSNIPYLLSDQSRLPATTPAVVVSNAIMPGDRNTE